MTEYIDKSAAVRILEAKSDMAVCTGTQPYFMAAAKMIGLLPSADVAPVRHGRWIEHTKVIIPEPYNKWEQAWKCSECGFDDGFVAYNFCPNCGAKMFESEDE